MTQYYVLFHNHNDGIALYQELKKLELKITIAPTPRSLSKCCGISLLIDEKDRLTIWENAKSHHIPIIDIAGIENTFNVNRDLYC